MGKISKLLKDEFASVYCGNCKYDGDDCDGCNRKQMGWALSKKAAKELERKIIDLKE